MLALTSSASSYANSPEFEFGRVGGNIQPYTVGIGPSGAVWSRGAIRLPDPNRTVTAAARQRLLVLALRERFFALPPRITCAGSLPDFASMFISVSTSTRARTVRVRGGCSSRFQTLLGALQRAAGVPVGRR